MAYHAQNRLVARDELSEETKNEILRLWTVKSFYRRNGSLAPVLTLAFECNLGPHRSLGYWTDELMVLYFQTELTLMVSLVDFIVGFWPVVFKDCSRSGILNLFPSYLSSPIFLMYLFWRAGKPFLSFTIFIASNFLSSLLSGEPGTLETCYD